jgi:serine/threonine-protein kinase
MNAESPPGDRSSSDAPRTRPTLEDFRTEPSEKDGTVLGERYRVLGLVGTGATAEVYLAEDATDQALVVVKWLRPHAARNYQVRQRFVQGARAAMSVSHPNIRRVFSLEDSTGELPYVVMKALRGEPLDEYLERRGPMARPLALAMIRCVAEGLAAAHAAGIVHRDLKPGNLFLVGEPGAPVSAKLIDFGFAKDTRSDPDSGPPSTNLVLGTAQYMAPEQVLADPVDARTDVYGFGVVLFRLITGHLPFDLETGVDLFSHQLFSPTPPPSWLADDLEPDLEQVILRCVRKHPDNRYHSMQTVVEELDRIALGRPIIPLPLVRQPDVYKPRNESGREAAEALASHFGTEPPPPPTARFDPESVNFRRER